LCATIRAMKKAQAIKLLAGKYGNATDAARILGISRQAVYKWPDPLPRRIAKRVDEALQAMKETKR
jgi:hypothetical protein